MDPNTEEISELADRRYALRQKCRAETLVVEHAGMGTMTAVVLDISREGFRLFLPKSVPCGDEVIIHPPADTDLLKIRATIVRQCLVMHDEMRMIECGVKVADTAIWRKHTWFLALRVGSGYGDARESAAA